MRRRQARGGQEQLPLLAWRAFGNEPFWSVRVDGDALVFSTPDDPSGRTFRPATMRCSRMAACITKARMATPPSASTSQKDRCSDGMSDNVYALTAEFRYGDMDYKGCAEAAE